MKIVGEMQKHEVIERLTKLAIRAEDIRDREAVRHALNAINKESISEETFERYRMRGARI